MKLFDVYEEYLEEPIRYSVADVLIACGKIADAIAEKRNGRWDQLLKEMEKDLLKAYYTNEDHAAISAIMSKIRYITSLPQQLAEVLIPEKGHAALSKLLRKEIKRLESWFGAIPELEMVS
jgi:hypothetical protein